jgi:prepilin-type N-terminal cleavage/methylation domain-containing protein
VIKKIFKSKKGFTLIELVVVISILGVLALTIMPQIIGALNLVRLRTAKEKLIDDLYSANNLAIANHATVWFNIDAPGNSYSYGITGALETVNLSSEFTNVIITSESFGGSFEYNWWGQPSAGGSIVLNGTETINIIEETGFIHVP